jgi:hypothetical protein
MEDDQEGEDSLAPEDKAMLSKFLVATLRVAIEDPTSEVRGKGKGKKVLYYIQILKFCCGPLPLRH